jgi:hypothetical protein
VAVEPLEQRQIDRILDLITRTRASASVVCVCVCACVRVSCVVRTSCCAGWDLRSSMLSQVRTRRKDMTDNPPNDRPVPPAIIKKELNQIPR